MMLRGPKDAQKKLLFKFIGRDSREHDINTNILNNTTNHTVAPPHSPAVNVSLGKAPIEPTGNNDDPDTVDKDGNTLETQEEAPANDAGSSLTHKSSSEIAIWVEIRLTYHRSGK